MCVCIHGCRETHTDMRAVHVYVNIHVIKKHMYVSGNYKDDRSGEKNGRALLTQKKADDIRKIYASGMWSYSTLAPLFDVAPQTVAAIIQGRTWNK